MHLEPGQLVRYADGEMDGRDAESIAHIAACPECRQRVEQCRREWADITMQLASVDVAAPHTSVEAVIARHHRPQLHRLRIAAAAALTVLVAGSLYAVPRLQIFDRASEPVTRGAPAAGDRRAGEAQDTLVPAGIALVPGRSLRIDIETAFASGAVHVSMTRDAAVTVTSAPHAATFGSAEQRLLVTVMEDGARLDVRVPRAAPRIEIRVNDRRVLVVSDGAVIDGPVADRDGILRIPF